MYVLYTLFAKTYFLKRIHMKTAIIRVLEFVMTARISMFTLSNSYVNFYHCFAISMIVHKNLIDMLDNTIRA